jgi:hypothetical protein
VALRDRRLALAHLLALRVDEHVLARLLGLGARQPERLAAHARASAHAAGRVEELEVLVLARRRRERVPLVDRVLAADLLAVRVDHDVLAGHRRLVARVVAAAVNRQVGAKLRGRELARLRLGRVRAAVEVLGLRLAVRVRREVDVVVAAAGSVNLPDRHRKSPSCSRLSLLETGEV